MALSNCSYAWITEWIIEISPIWGQYQNCNGYDPPGCFGVNDYYVGREACVTRTFEEGARTF
jgi:hypothetical protein